MVGKVLIGAWVLTFGGIISACSADIDSARNLILEGEDFAVLLAKNYREHSIFEAERMYDWPDASRYARKALAASEGDPPPPESLADWHLPAAHVPRLSGARVRLITAFKQGFALTDPAQAATAQSSFDCWVEQLEEGWQVSHIKQCRIAFEAALESWHAQQITVSAIATSPPSDAVNAGQADPPGKDQPADGGDTVCESDGRADFHIIVPFAHDSAALDGPGENAVDTGARLARAARVTEVFIEGHADSVGASDYNLGLSLRRAETVWRRLIAGGVSAAKLWLGPRGETQPETLTADGTRFAANRRVTLLLAEDSPSDAISTEPCTELGHPTDSAP